MTEYELTLLENVERSAKKLQKVVHKDLDHYEILVDLINHMLTQIDLIKWENDNDNTRKWKPFGKDARGLQERGETDT